ncbi:MULTISPECIES: hypothetical protein [Deinococcus]|uniref:Uncharacterized protein n=1 Tax=Deinococcus rufus TaxID=2136097 RepID=A0ABV7Z8Y9_9DEIO|nr:hypothetical protein [Deinococcus sp. AB2017081]WQE97488.1 hypothetical protein U2P90_19995 [Deinococcus sp. AB2017081]
MSERVIWQGILNRHSVKVGAVEMTSRALPGSPFEQAREEKYFLEVNGEDYHTPLAFSELEIDSDKAALEAARAYVTALE